MEGATSGTTDKDNPTSHLTPLVNATRKTKTSSKRSWNLFQQRVRVVDAQAGGQSMRCIFPRDSQIPAVEARFKFLMDQEISHRNFNPKCAISQRFLNWIGRLNGRPRTSTLRKEMSISSITKSLNPKADLKISSIGNSGYSGYGLLASTKLGFERGLVEKSNLIKFKARSPEIQTREPTVSTDPTISALVDPNLQILIELPNKTIQSLVTSVYIFGTPVRNRQIMFTVKKCRIVYNDLVLFVPYFNKSIMFDIVTVGAGTIAVVPANFVPRDVTPNNHNDFMSYGRAFWKVLSQGLNLKDTCFTVPNFLGVVFVKTIFQDLKYIAQCFSLDDGIAAANSPGTAACAVAISEYHASNNFRLGNSLSVQDMTGGVVVVKVAKVTTISNQKILDVEVSGTVSTGRVHYKRIDRIQLPILANSS